MLVIQIDVIHAQPREAGFAGGLYVLGPAIDAARVRIGRVQADAELGGQEHLIAAAGDGLADQDLVGVRAVHVGGVQQAHAALQRAVDHGDGFGVVAAAAVEGAHAHAAQALGGDGRALAAQHAGFHRELLADGGGRALVPETGSGATRGTIELAIAWIKPQYPNPV